MRLIDAYELLKAVDTWDKFGCDADTKLVPVKDCYVPYIHYDDVVKAIKGMPTVDVLDKIRAEIIKQFEGCYLEEDMTDERKAEHKAYKNVLKIIDKYKGDKE